MGMTVGGKRGILSEVNVVPLIDILLVLLVIFMIIPHRQVGLQASLPQESGPKDPVFRRRPLWSRSPPMERLRSMGR
jgi:biopolymer transport protein TolR